MKAIIVKMWVSWNITNKAQEVLRWISTSLVNLDSELGLESESQVFDLFLVDIGFGFDIVLENWNFILFKPYS